MHRLHDVASRFGVTLPERLLGIIGLVAVTVATASALLELDASYYNFAWAVGFVSIISWNVLVFIRRRRA